MMVMREAMSTECAVSKFCSCSVMEVTTWDRLAEGKSEEEGGEARKHFTV